MTKKLKGFLKKVRLLYSFSWVLKSCSLVYYHILFKYFTMYNVIYRKYNYYYCGVFLCVLPLLVELENIYVNWVVLNRDKNNICFTPMKYFSKNCYLFCFTLKDLKQKCRIFLARSISSIHNKRAGSPILFKCLPEIAMCYFAT